MKEYVGALWGWDPEHDPWKKPSMWTAEIINVCLWIGGDQTVRGGRCGGEERRGVGRGNQVHFLQPQTVKGVDGGNGVPEKGVFTGLPSTEGSHGGSKDERTNHEMRERALFEV